MKKSGLIISILLLGFICLAFYMPYLKVININNKFTRSDQLIDHLGGDTIERIALLTMFYPLLLIVESTFWTSINKLWKRILLFNQGLLIAAGSFLIWIIMSLHIFVTVNRLFVSGDNLEYLLINSLSK